MSKTEEENARLQAQVTDLQARMSEMVNNTLARRVRTFMVAIKHPVLHTPQVPPDDRVRLRLRLIAEEFFELLDAAFPTKQGWMGACECPITIIRDLIDKGDIKVDLVEFADALADIDYVVEGARAEFGIQGASVADEVHRSNMQKFWPCSVCSKLSSAERIARDIDLDVLGVTCQECGGSGRCMKVRPDGKVLKPGGWTPPNITAVLRGQGWKVPWTPPEEKPLTGIKPPAVACVHGTPPCGTCITEEERAAAQAWADLEEETGATP